MILQLYGSMTSGLRLYDSVALRLYGSTALWLYYKIYLQCM